MLKMNLQVFAHKKGVGSTKNGRDSESKRLGAKRADGQFARRPYGIGLRLKSYKKHRKRIKLWQRQLQIYFYIHKIK